MLHEPALLWSIGAATGLIVSSYLATQSSLDLWALRKYRNGRRVTAFNRLASELIRGSIHALFLKIGLPLIGTEDNGFSETILILMWGDIGILLNSLLAARTRFLLYQTRNAEPPVEPPL